MKVLEKVIGGRTYTFSRVSALKALDLELSLAKVAGSWLAGIDLDVVAGMLKGGDDSGRAAFGLMMAQGISDIAQKLTLAELTRLMGLVFEYVSVNGTSIGDRIDEAFQDLPMDNWLVFIEALKVNLGPLGEGLLKGSRPQKPLTP
jgi:hypothetical protein